MHVLYVFGSQSKMTFETVRPILMLNKGHQTLHLGNNLGNLSGISQWKGCCRGSQKISLDYSAPGVIAGEPFNV